MWTKIPGLQRWMTETSTPSGSRPAGGRHAYLVRHEVSHASSETSQTFPHFLHFNLSLSGVFVGCDIFLTWTTPHLDIIVTT